MTLPSFLKLPHCTEKTAVLQNIPVTTPRLIIARPMSCFGIRRGWSYGHLRRCQSGSSSRVASPWTSLRKPISSIVPNLRNPIPFRHLLMNCNIAFSFQVEVCFKLKFIFGIVMVRREGTTPGHHLMKSNFVFIYC